MFTGKNMNARSTIQVVTPEGERMIAGSPDVVVSKLLNATGVRLRLGCGGVGACGLCRVRIEAGEPSAPTASEVAAMSAEELSAGVRLGCQVRLPAGGRIRIERAATVACWMALPPTEQSAETQAVHDAARAHPLGVAVDLGTLQIRVALWDLETKTRLAARVGLNPQRDLGVDVLTRLTAAAESDQTARELSWLVRGAIGDALAEMAGAVGCELRRVRRVAVVGNTAMLCLLANRQRGVLLQPDAWTREIDCTPTDTAAWAAAWGIAADALVQVIPPLAGFVGSDFLAAVLATRLTEGVANTLLVDVGTNSEIGFWDGETLWATSSPGGPAFESAGAGCGMPAETGAIFRFEREAGTASGFRCEVIGVGEPRGICGSGLVDAVACLLEAGTLNAAGRFARGVDERGVVLATGRGEIVLRRRDIDAFQRAKSATAAGVACVLARTGRSAEELERLCVCGAFGSHLNVRRAQAVGLLPTMPSERVELHENAALRGCERLLLANEGAAGVASLKRITKLINLATAPEYEERFVEHLFLRPMPVETKEAV